MPNLFNQQPNLIEKVEAGKYEQMGLPGGPQWLGTWASTAGGTSLELGAAQCSSQKEKKKRMNGCLNEY